MNPQYGYGRHDDKRWHIVNPADPGVLLCGRRCWFRPVVQPAHDPASLAGLHDECLVAHQGLASPEPEPELVECPVCGGTVQVVRGVLVRHGVWRVGADGPVETGARCGGGGTAVGGEG